MEHLQRKLFLIGHWCNWGVKIAMLECILFLLSGHAKFKCAAWSLILFVKSVSVCKTQISILLNGMQVFFRSFVRLFLVLLFYFSFLFVFVSFVNLSILSRNNKSYLHCHSIFVVVHRGSWAALCSNVYFCCCFCLFVCFFFNIL